MLRRTLPLVLSLCLVACGGGGGSGASGTPPTTTTPPPNQAPTATFTFTPSSGTAPLTVSFDGTGASDADGTVTDWNWQFGDGGTGTGATTTHEYTTAGSWTVTLRVTDDDGATATATGTVTVSAAAPSTGVTLSGEVLIQTGSAIDADTNDPAAPGGDNDDFGTAQPIPNPAAVGGWLSRGSDDSDFFGLGALGGETLTLEIAEDPVDADLDLFVYGLDRTILLASEGTTDTETLVLPAGATSYFVEVRAFRGASNYVLTVGDTPAPTAARAGALNLGHEFVPGEVLLGPATTTLGATAEPGLRTLAALPGGTRHVRMSAERMARIPPHRPEARGAGREAERLATLRAIKALRSSGRYAWVEPNWIRRPLRTPNDQFFPNQWHYGAINLPQAWDLTQGSSDVVVAVVDTGILRTHPEFVGKLVGGYDFISDPDRAGDGNGVDPDPTDEGDAVTGTSSFHGSHVAGTIGARTDNAVPGGTGGGVAGVGWDTRLMPLRVLGIDGGTSADLIQALRYAAGLSNSSGTVPPVTAAVINLSLGGAGFSSAEQDLYRQLRSLGIIVIAAAGNDASDAPSYPAAYDDVISVSATTIANESAPYSNFGATIDVAAPGGFSATDVNGDGIGDGVLSTVGDDRVAPPAPALGVLQGTSMASPHVAGVAALMKAVNPGLTAAEFDALLVAGQLTNDLGIPGRDDRFGYGLIDARKAVVAALELSGGTLPAILTSNPSALNLGALLTELPFRIGNVGDEAVSVTQPRVLPDAPWLTVEAVDVDGSGLGAWQVTADRTGLADGLYAADLVFDYASGGAPATLTLPVRLQVVGTDLTADAGFHYVLVIDPDSFETVQQVQGPSSAGRYLFRFEEIPPGTYEIYAGTDSDNDGFICDPGEACGIYRSLSFEAPTLVTVGEQDRTALDFVTGFRSTLLSNGTAATASDAKRIEGAQRPQGIPRLRQEAD